MPDQHPQVFSLDDARRLPLGEPVAEYVPTAPNAVRSFKCADGKTMQVGVNADGDLVHYEPSTTKQLSKRKKEVE